MKEVGKANRSQAGEDLRKFKKVVSLRSSSCGRARTLSVNFEGITTYELNHVNFR